MTWLVCKEIGQICLQNVLIPRFNIFINIKPYTDQYFTYYYYVDWVSCQNYGAKLMSSNWVSANCTGTYKGNVIK